MAQDMRQPTRLVDADAGAVGDGVDEAEKGDFIVCSGGAGGRVGEGEIEVGWEGGEERDLAMDEVLCVMVSVMVCVSYVCHACVREAADLGVRACRRPRGCW